MTTIAISIDDRTLKALDDLAIRMAGARKGGKRAVNRSEVVRLAISELAAKRARADQEARDRGILKKHSTRINRQAAALVAQQAKK